MIFYNKKDPKWVFLLNWQRPTFPGSFPPSIIGAKELNCCVRDGNRCILFAKITRLIYINFTLK